MFAREQPGCERGEHWLEADEDCGVRGRGILLRPGLRGETEGCGTERGDQHGENQRAAPDPARVFDIGDGEQWKRDGGENCSSSDLHYGERADGVMRDVAADE